MAKSHTAGSPGRPASIQTLFIEEDKVYGEDNTATLLKSLLAQLDEKEDIYLWKEQIGKLLDVIENADTEYLITNRKRSELIYQLPMLDLIKLEYIHGRLVAFLEYLCDMQQVDVSELNDCYAKLAKLRFRLEEIPIMLGVVRKNREIKADITGKEIWDNILACKFTADNLDTIGNKHKDKLVAYLRDEATDCEKILASRLAREGSRDDGTENTLRYVLSIRRGILDPVPETGVWQECIKFEKSVLDDKIDATAQHIFQKNNREKISGKKIKNQINHSILDTIFQLLKSSLSEKNPDSSVLSQLEALAGGIKTTSALPLPVMMLDYIRNALQPINDGSQKWLDAILNPNSIIVQFIKVVTKNEKMTVEECQAIVDFIKGKIKNNPLIVRQAPENKETELFVFFDRGAEKKREEFSDSEERTLHQKETSKYHANKDDQKANAYTDTVYALKGTLFLPHTDDSPEDIRRSKGKPNIPSKIPEAGDLIEMKAVIYLRNVRNQV